MEDKFIGIGKIILNSLDSCFYNIPHLHFIMSKNGEYFEAINLEFGLVASDKSSKIVVEDLTEMLIEYIERTIKTFDFDTLIATVSSSGMNDYWTEYRKLEFEFAKTKHDIGHELVHKLEEEIRQKLLKQYGINSEAKYSVRENVA